MVYGTGSSANINGGPVMDAQTVMATEEANIATDNGPTTMVTPYKRNRDKLVAIGAILLILAFMVFLFIQA